MVDCGEAGVYNLGRHEIGEDFLCPDIIKPVHCHQITKPHMRRFMRDQVSAV